MAGPGQLGTTTIGVASGTTGPLPTVYVESLARTDARIVDFEVTVRKDWLGEVNANLALKASRWEQEDSPGDAAQAPSPA
jgi:hypothetical protein